MKKRILITILISIFLFTGCVKVGNKKHNEKIAEVIITKNFGSELIEENSFNKYLDYSVIELMQEKYDVELAYGGGFINSINGITSGYTNKENKKKEDWFYYINGIKSPIGADEYYIKKGDVIQWDFQPWKNSDFSASIIGAYPETFNNGFQGNVLKTEIYTSKGFKSMIKPIKKEISVEKSNSLNEFSLEKLNDGSVNNIIISSFDEINKFDYFKEIQNKSKYYGLYYDISNDEITALDYNFSSSKKYKKAAVISSSLKSYGEIGTIWFVLGNDDKLIEKAINLLNNSSDKLRGKTSVIITEDSVVELPKLN